jgi:hypothetical protein
MDPHSAHMFRFPRLEGTGGLCSFAFVRPDLAQIHMHPTQKLSKMLVLSALTCTLWTNSLLLHR